MTDDTYDDSYTWVVMAVSDLPQTEPFRVECMNGSQSVTQPSSGCCWYHGGDWRKVNAVAMRLLGAAQAAGVAPDATGGYVRAAAAAEGLGGWDDEALRSLFVSAWAIQITEKPVDGIPRFVSGQHRVHAMRDVGATHTIVLWYGDNPFVELDEL